MTLRCAAYLLLVAIVLPISIVSALAEPNGLLAAGGALSSDWLLYAYRHGIFPWYSRNEPILWWSPDPRCVLVPQEFHRSRSLARSARGAGL